MITGLQVDDVMLKKESTFIQVNQVVQFFGHFDFVLGASNLVNKRVSVVQLEIDLIVRCFAMFPSKLTIVIFGDF